MSYKDCFLSACEEYNCYGIAVSNKKIQVEKSMALRLYGLKERQIHLSCAQVSRCLPLARGRFDREDMEDAGTALPPVPH